jgi:hypothetical protein
MQCQRRKVPTLAKNQTPVVHPKWLLWLKGKNKDALLSYQPTDPNHLHQPGCFSQPMFSSYITKEYKYL